MVDLGRPDNYADARGVIELFRFEQQSVGGPVASTQFDLLTTDESPMLYRVRFVSLEGQTDTAVGSVVLTFQGLTSGLVGDPWPDGGPLVAAADTAVSAGDKWFYTWNTEISDNYSNFEADFGQTWVGGLPLLFLPRLTTFSLHMTATGGYAGDYLLTGGHMQMERFAADTVTGGSPQTLEQVYLLPTNQ